MDDSVPQSTSPVVLNTKPLAMDFPDAVRAMIHGEKVTKEEWADREVWGELKDGKLMLHKKDGKYYLWIVSDGDMLGEDWYAIGPSILSAN